MPNNSDNILMKFMDLFESNIEEHQKEMKAIDFKDFIKSGCKKNNRLNEKEKRDIVQKELIEVTSLNFISAKL